MKKINKKGFTLIEVVLVLAIGGLIFLLAFIAFQQVSRNRRDTQRRSDAARTVAALANYRADRNNTLPAASANNQGCGTVAADTFGQFLTTYMCKNGNFDGPSKPYTVVDWQTAYLATDADYITYKPNWNCSDVADTGKVAIKITLENGFVCKDDR